MTGRIPFACTFAVFAAGRAFEQIRNSVAYPRLNVKICGSHGGVQVGKDGATHQAIEDLAIMSAIPNMVVLNPGDAVEMEAAVKAMVEYDGPVYVRLGRNPVPVVFDRETYRFQIGRGTVVREGGDVTLVAPGQGNHHKVRPKDWKGGCDGGRNRCGRPWLRRGGSPL